jgi:hypothetical protein
VHNIDEQEFENLCLDAEVLKISPNLKTDTATLLDVVMLMIPLILAANKGGKCVAVMLDPVGIALSGYTWKGSPFIKPLLNEAIDMAKTLDCFNTHAQ